MSIKEKKLEQRVELWALIGPFIMMATLTILLIKPGHHPLYIPLAALIGLPICWKWKLPGLAIGLGILGGLVAYQMSHETSDQAAVWDFMLGISMALSFCVTALSYKEVQEVVLHLQNESASRLQNFLQVDEKIRSIELQRDADISENKAKVDLLTQQLTESKAQLQNYEQLVQLSRDEMLHANREHERLLQESFQTRHEYEMIKENLAEAESQIGLLHRQLSEKTSEPLEVKRTDCDMEVRHQAVLHEMNEYIDQLNREKQLLESTLKSLQTEVDTLRSLVDQKELIVKESAAAIESLKERASLNAQELAEYRKKTDELIEAYSKKELCLNGEVEKLLDSCDQLRSELSRKQEELNKEAQALQRAKGMYGQLRDQFEDKNLTLEKTRKELFLTSEVLLKCQRELQEESLYCIEENSPPSLLSYVLTLDAELQNIQKRHDEETNALYSLIQHLINEPRQTPANNQLQPSQVINGLQPVPEPRAPASSKGSRKTPKKEAAKEENSNQTSLSKAESNPKKPKSTKTTAWANTILSRWSSFEEQQD